MQNFLAGSAFLGLCWALVFLDMRTMIHFEICTGAGQILIDRSDIMSEIKKDIDLSTFECHQRALPKSEYLELRRRLRRATLE
jgi:hypothetical protein